MNHFFQIVLKFNIYFNSKLNNFYSCFDTTWKIFTMHCPHQSVSASIQSLTPTANVSLHSSASPQDESYIHPPQTELSLREMYIMIPPSLSVDTTQQHANTMTIPPNHGPLDVTAQQNNSNNNSNFPPWHNFHSTLYSLFITQNKHISCVSLYPSLLPSLYFVLFIKIYFNVAPRLPVRK